MAINFPDSPTNGDVVILSGNTYTYNSATTTWDKANPGAAVNISDVSPTNPVVGDTWFSSTDGAYYVYYNDGTSSQWVATSGPAGAAGSSVNLSAYAGDILPDVDSSRSLGSLTKKWKSLYLSSNTLFLGDSGSISAGAGGAISMPSLKIGSGAGAVELTASADGKLETKGTTAAGVTESAAKAAGSGVVLYDSIGAFPISGIDTGNMGFSKDKKALYIWDSAEWDRMSVGPQIGPRFVTTPASSLNLNNDGSTPLAFTVKAVDEGGFPVTYDWDAYSSSTVYDSNSLPPQITGVSRDSGVFSVIASSVEANAGAVSFRTKASDGVLFTPYIVTLNLRFATIEALTGDATSGTVGDHKYWYSNHASGSNTSKYMNLTVTPGGTFYIGMVGATGSGHGESNRSAGGKAAYSNATITVPAGVTTMTVYTGGGGRMGVKNTGSSPWQELGGGLGGGNSGTGGSASWFAVASGGGLVGLFKNAYSATPSQSDALMVVGSSGGASGAMAPGHLGGYGGKPGADGGNSHETGNPSGQVDYGGYGGTATAGGIRAPHGDTGGYRWNSAGFARATSGSALQGGTGGAATYEGGGGGGAGYFGGGGGVGGGGYSSGAGGGGSGYLASGQVINNATYNKSGDEHSEATPVTQLIAWADGLLGSSSGIPSSAHGGAAPVAVPGNAGYAIVVELAS